MVIHMDASKVLRLSVKCVSCLFTMISSQSVENTILKTLFTLFGLDFYFFDIYLTFGTVASKRVEACISLVYMASADEFLTIEVASSVMGWLWACFSQHICLLKFLAKTKHRQSGSTKIIS